MSNLLSANFIRLRKNKCFWGCFLFMAAAAVYVPVMRCISVANSGYKDRLDNGFFFGTLFVSILIAVFCGLFTGTEYSDGTIRNKLIIGHRRTHIYFSYLLTNVFAGLAMQAVYFVVFLCIGTPLMEPFSLNTKTLLCFIAIAVMLPTALSAIFTMLAMIISSKATVGVICVLSIFLMIIAGTYINFRLREPETYTNYSFTPEDGLREELEEKNPRYLEGTEREVYQFLYDFLPGGQVLQCSTLDSKNAPRLPVYSGIIFIISTAAGIIIFRQKDIK